MNTYSGSITIEVSNTFTSQEFKSIFANLLEGLMFVDDGINIFLGIQDGNKLTIIGISETNYGDKAGVREILFGNFPDQIIGEQISIDYHGLYNPSLSKDAIDGNHPNLFITPYEYKNVNQISTNLIRNTSEELNEWVQGHIYEIKLTWYDYSATYYVVFECAPSILDN